MNNKYLPKKIAALVEGIDHVCYRYRLQAFEPYLNSKGWRIEAYPIPRGIIAALKLVRTIRSADVVFLQRTAPIRPYLRLLRKNVKRLVFDFDDAVFRRDSFAKKGRGTRQKRFDAVVCASDAVIAGNEFLAQRARRFAKSKRVVTIPTCIETKTYEREMLSEGRTSPSGAMVLAWIGSSSTLPLLTGQGDMLNRIGREFSSISLKVICDSFPSFKHIHVHPVPWSVDTEIRELMSCHVGISWLPEDEWGMGKCGLKVLQYMAAGLPVVANPFGIHLQMIEHGKSGFLPKTPENWIHAVKMLHEDPELAKRMGARGREIVHARYSVSHWASMLYDILNG
jgi:hypothetical protein